jgi:hypothetical protein
MSSNLQMTIATAATDSRSKRLTSIKNSKVPALAGHFAATCLASVLGLFALVGPAQATLISLVDGTLAESTNAQTGVGIQQALSAEFNAVNGPMTFSGTVDPTQAGAGDYNIGMTVGNVYFLVHPGFTGTPGIDQGAFRFNNVNLGTSLVDPVSNGGNKNIGFTPDATAIDFEIVLNTVGSNYSFDVSIQQGLSSFMSTYSLAQSVFGAGGDIASFGAFHVGTSPSRGSLAYSGFTASVGVVPEPSIIALFGLGLLGLGFARRRKA